MSRTRNGQKLSGAVDWPKFGRRIRREVVARKKSFRVLAAQLGGPNYATLQRSCIGKPCSVELFLFYCHSFKIDPMSVYRRKRRS